MREIPLTQGKVALVDDEDYEELAQYKWTASKARKTYYAVRNVRTKTGRWTVIRMHKLMTGWPQTDHKNGNGLDNQRSNLRPSTSQQNGRNRTVTRGSSKYLGVSRHRDGKWMARISLDSGYKYLGLFADEEAAARVYDEAARERDPEFCHLNFP